MQKAFDAAKIAIIKIAGVEEKIQAKCCLNGVKLRVSFSAAF
jgi:hypothetical protein